MTTHFHGGIQTDHAKEVMFRFRTIYARYFNTKYGRRGRLGEKNYFSLEVEGLHHQTALLNYILRQGLHHGLVPTPFSYPHGSANSFFRKDLGKWPEPELLPDACRYHYLPSNIRVPVKYRMDKSGLLLRDDVLDTAYVEEIYISPRNYLFQMNRLSDEKDLINQKKENDTPPVTLDVVESGVPGFDLRQALLNEQGRVNLSKMSDLELCGIIDRQIVPRYFRGQGHGSVYALSHEVRARIAEGLWQESVRGSESPRDRRFRQFLGGKSVSQSQLRRCLCLNG
jgi:hypothetical protein